jgi:hypothetical protein
MSKIWEQVKLLEQTLATLTNMVEARDEKIQGLIDELNSPMSPAEIANMLSSMTAKGWKEMREELLKDGIDLHITCADPKEPTKYRLYLDTKSLTKIHAIMGWMCYSGQNGTGGGIRDGRIAFENAKDNKMTLMEDTNIENLRILRDEACKRLVVRKQTGSGVLLSVSDYQIEEVK